MKTGRALLAVALLAGTLSACDAGDSPTGDSPNRASASEGDKALCVYISSLKVGELMSYGFAGLDRYATDGVLIGLTAVLNRNYFVEAVPKNAVLRRCRDIGVFNPKP